MGIIFPASSGSGKTSPLHFRYFNPSAFIHKATEKAVFVKRVIFPEKPASSPKTRLVKILKAMAVSRLRSCSLANHPLAEASTVNCVKLLQRAECYSLTGSNLQERIDAVLDLFHTQ